MPVGENEDIGTDGEKAGIDGNAAGVFRLDPRHAVRKVSPGISLEGLMLKLKLQYFGHLMGIVDSLEKTLMLGGIGGRRKGDDRDEMAGWHH